MDSRSFGTHDGSFHADEVTACSLLLLFDCIDQEKVRRTRDPSILASCDYVCDVGGSYEPTLRRFDHHQAEYSGLLSSAGMVLLYLREQGWISESLYDWFDKGLIRGIDAHDNGRSVQEEGVATFSHVIANFLPICHEASSEEMDAAFFQAVSFTLVYLRQMKERHAYMRRCEGIVRDAMARGGQALIFDRSLPWMDNFFALGGAVHPAQFVVMPAGGHWKLRGIPPTLEERMKVRRPLPAHWAGLHEAELREASGIEGAIFCHKGLFISIWNTKEEALRALHLALQKEGTHDGIR